MRTQPLKRIKIEEAQQRRKIMNVRMQKYKKNRLSGMNIRNAARAAGYSESYVRQNGPENKVKQSLEDSFEQAGLTDSAIVKHAIEGLNALSEIIIEGAKYGDKPEWAVRHKYFETILKLTNRLKEKADIQINQYTQIWQGAVEKSNRVTQSGKITTA
jgi:hypothetical protein